jgi:hypothetical protein
MSLGPRHISSDRVDYIEEISESWKKQLLLNIVKIRYFDPPTFLDVASIINQYGIENQINADSRIYWPLPDTSGRYATIGGYSRYTDKPTITYTPLTGQKFTKNLLTPIPPSAVVGFIQSGWPVDMIFSLTVKTINGVDNGTAGRISNDDQSDFNRLLKAMRTVQAAGVSDIRVERVETKELVVFVISDDIDREKFQAEIQEIRSILNIRSETNRYKIVLGSLPQSDDEIALLTRSVLEIILEMASAVEVPPKHVEEKRVNSTASDSESSFMLTRIQSSPSKPQDAYTAIKYQDVWFWIDNKDIRSKRNFALLMIFMSLTESEQKSSGPLLTIGG